MSSLIFSQKKCIFTGVHQQVYFLPDAPQVTVSPELITVVEGSNLNLKCATSGKPIPKIKWTKVGGSDVPTDALLLTIVNVTRPRTANSRVEYQCIASNGVGTPAIATAIITVNCKFVDKIVVGLKNYHKVKIILKARE